MKFCAPTANWDMKSESGWWPMLGSAQTAAGVRVSPETALTYSAVFAATRVITETMASLPVALLEQVNDRKTRKATDHPLYPLLHDAPHPEQDIAAWLDMQVNRQLNWGDAYAEIQRDSTGEIKALLPIHPSRIPATNIYRNARDPRGWSTIEIGQPGEIVYQVTNDDGTRTPIPASDMLHVPGVLSSNGVTGRSIVVVGAEAIGIATATERHAGAFFRNGASTNMALKHPKTMSKEVADRLREQWQRVYGGVSNHYKTLILEEGMDAVELTFAPEASQLLESRQFGAREVARIYRVPPHMIGDLSRATWSNIESEEMSFVVHTLLPWIVRWEKALYRQLLTPEEKKRYRFKFNVMGLLRGDSASRAAFYQVLFNMGAASPNDIREREDMNSIDGGDQYFVPANNLMPLDKIAQMAQAQIDKLNEPAPQPVAPQTVEGDEEVEDKRLAEVLALLEQRDTLDAERLAVRQQKVQESEELLRDGLRLAIEARLVGLTDYECRAVRQATNRPGAFPTWQAEFYAEFAGKVAAALRPFAKSAERLGFEFSPEAVAANYCGDSVRLLEPLLDVACGDLAGLADDIVTAWSARASGVAEFIIPRRSQQCAA